MRTAQQRSILAAAVAICVSYPAAAFAQTDTQTEYLSVVTGMIAEQAPRSAIAAATIRDAFQPYLDPLLLNDYSEIEEALASGGLVRLPLDARRFNIRLRLDGSNPIGEKDVAHQASYVSARAATIGCLLDVASRVTSGPIEVTSLVRHAEYQEQLRTTNANATTAVPTHALGLAFDIAMVNTPLPTVLEIRDVLREMSDAGAVLVIVERQQLVFHVVPQPSRLGWYSEVYARAMAGQPWAHDVDVRLSLTPTVTTAIGALRPLPAMAAEWWAADNVPIDLPEAAPIDVAPATDFSRMRLMGRYITLVGEFLSATWQRLPGGFGYWPANS